jgi:hypothetical protein
MQEDAHMGMGWLRARVGYPSGQREQTVNLPAHAFEGSNPSPTTTTEGGGGSGEGTTAGSAGVAQLVERKPSKLDVAGSSPVSRSEVL